MPDMQGLEMRTIILWWIALILGFIGAELNGIKKELHRLGTSVQAACDE